MDLAGRINGIAELETQYREPSERAAGKVVTSIDPGSARFIDLCPMLILSTCDGHSSIDASPRGGPPGFLQRLDDTHLAVPDLAGNNRLDSFRNILANPWAGLLLIMPGKDETLRINGPAGLTNDAGILDGFSSELRRPKLAIVVETAELYGHCAKALRRGRVWDASSWQDIAHAPDLAEIYGCQFDSMDVEETRRLLGDSYANALLED